MNIYKVTWNEGNDYDRYDSFICYAESIEEAKALHPDGDYLMHPLGPKYSRECNSWCKTPDEVSQVTCLATDVEYHGESLIILSSYNAG